MKNAAQGHINEAAIMSKGTNDQDAKIEFLEKQASLQVPETETTVIRRQKRSLKEFLSKPELKVLKKIVVSISVSV